MLMVIKVIDFCFNIIDNFLCLCGENKDVYYFFLVCRIYLIVKNDFFIFDYFCLI